MSSSSNSKRLLFDHRYGWVVDEWKEPSQEALAGGRGMFCIGPLAIALVQIASHSIDAVATSAIKILQSRHNHSPQATISNHLRVLEFNGIPSTTSSVHQHRESPNLQ